MRSLAVLRAFLLLVFVGWLFIWVMLPTKTYKDSWTPNLSKKLNSTYFREQGTNLLLLTFPVMLIATLGAFYLHFQAKSSAPESSKGHQRHSWKRPVLVVSPLGILNAVELAFSVMFMALLVWSLANYLKVSFGHLHFHKKDEKVWQAKFRSVSLRLGYIGNICWAFLFFPVTRGSSVLPLFGLTSESSIKYHIWLGQISNILFAAHSIGFVIWYGLTDQMSEMIKWSMTYVPNFAGVIAFVISLVMWAASIYRVRRKMFEVFFFTHQLYVLYLFFYLLHVGVGYVCMILPGIFLFAIDRHLRFLQSRKRARLFSARLLPCGTTELTFAKNPALAYNPASILFVNVPSISKLQWHPFTVTSNSNLEPDKLTVAVTSQGSWSRKLYNELSTSLDRLEVSTEGPYGPASCHFLSRECLVMISGGSGITPFISIIREIIFRSTRLPNCSTPKVHLVAAFKSTADLAKLDLLLPASCAELSKLQMQIEAYITRDQEKSQLEDAHKLIESKWFKPNPLDSPVSSVLGPNSWLWLGAIISSSFVIFLLLLGILSRYWIYPIEKKGKVYHYSLKTIWDVILMCASVFIAATVIFLWQKRKNEMMEGKQIQNLEVPTPSTSSPGLWLQGGDRELESLPHQSLVQATKVHYGGRPDLKKILLVECKASNVGVMVCGPRKMRHEVAQICASGLAENLHFESISFNW